MVSVIGMFAGLGQEFARLAVMGLFGLRVGLLGFGAVVL
jgi:hypothetical protein